MFFFQDLVLFIGPGFLNRIEKYGSTTKLIIGSCWNSPSWSSCPTAVCDPKYKISLRSPSKSMTKSWRHLFNNWRTGIAHNLKTLCVPMAFAIFVNMTATSKQLVGYIKLFPFYWRAVIQFSGSVNKGKRSCLKAPPPRTHPLFTVLISGDLRKGCVRPILAWLNINFDPRLIKSRPPASMALIQMYWT